MSLDPVLKGQLLRAPRGKSLGTSEQQSARDLKTTALAWLHPSQRGRGPSHPDVKGQWERIKPSSSKSVAWFTRHPCLKVFPPSEWFQCTLTFLFGEQTNSPSFRILTCWWRRGEGEEMLAFIIHWRRYIFFLEAQVRMRMVPSDLPSDGKQPLFPGPQPAINSTYKSTLSSRSFAKHYWKYPQGQMLNLWFKGLGIHLLVLVSTRG